MEQMHANTFQGIQNTWNRWNWNIWPIVNHNVKCHRLLQMPISPPHASEKEKVSIKWKPVLVFLGCVRFPSQESITDMRTVRLSTSKTCHRLIGTSMSRKYKRKIVIRMQSSWSAWHCEHLELSSPAHHHNSHCRDTLLLTLGGNCSCNTSSRLWTKLRRIGKRSGLDKHYQKVEETGAAGADYSATDRTA